MLGKILGGGEFSQWASFVTPAFFDVMPARRLWQHGKALAQGTRDREAYARAVSERQGLLARSRLSITLEGSAFAKDSSAREVERDLLQAPAPLAASERAAQVVELYFHQILHGGVTLLDVRRQAFVDGRPLRWRPASWIARWDPSFLVALRQLYTGFYRGDSSGFRAGLAALHLSHSEDLFKQHFGDGQGAVRFEVKHFVSTFHQVFLRCRDAGTSLHPDFLLLGLYLASLYEHLEQLGVTVDVSGAFEKASELEPSALSRGASTAT